MGDWESLHAPVKHWLQTRCEQGDNKAALVRVRLQAAHSALGFDSLSNAAGGSVTLVSTGETGVSGRKIGSGGRAGVVVSSATLGLAASEKTGDSPGVGSANIFLGRVGVYKRYRAGLARDDSNIQKVVKHSDFVSS
jgi:hypothetical protein